MARTSYRRTFSNNNQLLVEMLAKRLGGWRERPLATAYRVDRTTIRFWCVKYNIQPVIPEIRVTAEIREQANVQLPQEKPKKHLKYQYLFDEEENVNPGKSYMEYVADHQKRDPKFVFRKNPYAIRGEDMY